MLIYCTKDPLKQIVKKNEIKVEQTTLAFIKYILSFVRRHNISKIKHIASVYICILVTEKRNETVPIYSVNPI